MTPKSKQAAPVGETVVYKVDSPFRGAAVPPPTAHQAGSAKSTSLRLRPLTGFEEEYIEAHLDTANTARLANEVLARCLVEPGADPGEGRERVRAMSIVERDQELVELRRISLGDEVVAEIECPGCRTSNEASFSLGSLPLQSASPPREITQVLEGGQAAVLRIPTAGDQEELVGTGGETAAERRTALLAQILVRFGDRQGPFDRDFVRALNAKTRRQLEAAIEEAMPEFDLTMAVVCRACQKKFSAPFDVRAFFLPK